MHIKIDRLIDRWIGRNIYVFLNGYSDRSIKSEIDKERERDKESERDKEREKDKRESKRG